jgi:hypothetical protein
MPRSGQRATRWYTVNNFPATLTRARIQILHPPPVSGQIYFFGGRVFPKSALGLNERRQHSGRHRRGNGRAAAGQALRRPLARAGNPPNKPS